MKSLFAALRFLSILPIRQGWAGQEKELACSVKFFPVAGLIMGTILAVFAWALGFVVPQTVVAAITVTGLVILTRGLHLDGLADTADGFWSVSGRSRTLEIMKDSHTGAMGVIAIVCVLLLKFACLAALNRDMLWRAVLLMVLTGRCMMIVPISVLPYARKEGGLGQLFYETKTIPNAFWGILAALVVGWFIAGTAGVAASVGSVLITIVFGAYCKWKIGGVTGDTLGATCQIAEVVTALVLCGFAAKVVVS